MINGNSIAPMSDLTRKCPSLHSVAPDSQIIVYCTGGVRAGFAYMALLANGFQNIQTYDGSWWEWCERPASGSIEPSNTLTVGDVEASATTNLLKHRTASNASRLILLAGIIGFAIALCVLFVLHFKHL